MDTDFVVIGDCIARPTRWRRMVLDAVCRWTGHLLWHSGSQITDPDGSLPLKSAHCRRCFRYGYVRGDYWLIK